MDEVKTKPDAIFELRNFDQFKNSVELFSRWRDELTLRLSGHGLRVKEIDDSHVALLELELPAEEFEIFEVERVAEVTIEVGRLMNALQRASKEDDLLRVEVNSDRVRLLYPRTRRYFEVPRLKSAVEEPPIPKFSIQGKVELDVRVLQLMLKDVGSLKQDEEEQVEIAADAEGIAFRAEDGKGKRYEMYLHAGDPGVFEISSYDGPLNGYARSVFLLEHLKKVISPKWRRVKLYIGNGRPLIVEYEVSGHGLLKVYLAPESGG